MLDGRMFYFTSSASIRQLLGLLKKMKGRRGVRNENNKKSFPVEFQWAFSICYK
jgi:hypothetical protein